jgi:hypothetical protein
MPVPVLDHADEARRLEQRLVRAGVEPRGAAAEHLHVELAALEVQLG